MYTIQEVQQRYQYFIEKRYGPDHTFVEANIKVLELVLALSSKEWLDKLTFNVSCYLLVVINKADPTRQSRVGYKDGGYHIEKYKIKIETENIESEHFEKLKLEDAVAQIMTLL